MRERLLGTQELDDVVGGFRGRGPLQGLDLATDRTSKQPADALVAAVARECLTRGLHLNIVQLTGMGGVFRMRLRA